MMLSKVSLRSVCLAAAVTTLACAHGRPDRNSPAGMQHLLLNDDSVLIPAGHSVFDALRQKLSAYRLGELAGAAGAKPLVVIDGIEAQAGVATLKQMQACHVAAVRVLRPLEAVAQYGGKADLGAILVQTRPSRERAATPGC
jgi:hypothetical protein